MGIEEYERYDALGLARLVRRKELTPVELVEEAISRIERHNPKLNAVVYKAYEEARATAKGKLKIQYYRSAIGFNGRQRLIVKGLGLGKLNTTRELIDTPAIRGMIAKVPHLVRILE